MALVGGAIERYVRRILRSPKVTDGGITSGNSAVGEVGQADIGQDLDTMLLAFAGRLTRLQTEILADLEVPLTIRQYRFLSRVDAGHTSLTALCRLAHRNPSTMSENVNKLVKQGLLTRETDAAEGRLSEGAGTS